MSIRPDRPSPWIVAWHFLTAVPLPLPRAVQDRAHQVDEADLAASMVWYPVVGLLIGVILVVADIVLRELFHPSVAAGLVVVLLVVLTRGLHQDGLADTVDGLAGGRTPAARLAIMRDPHIGALGATGLALSLLLRYAALLALPAGLRIAALLSAPIVSRCAMVAMAVSLPAARSDGGLAAPFVAGLTRGHLWRTLLVAALPLVVMALLLPRGLSVITSAGLCALVIVALLRRSYRQLFGGVSGDLLGATNEVVEISVLLVAPLGGTVG
ncbi:MAG: adenosylcobinamide-GDP ribazoletransferase [Nitrospiraceae bacterium]